MIDLHGRVHVVHVIFSDSDFEIFFVHKFTEFQIGKFEFFTELILILYVSMAELPCYFRVTFPNKIDEQKNLVTPLSIVISEYAMKKSKVSDGLSV